MKVKKSHLLCCLLQWIFSVSMSEGTNTWANYRIDKKNVIVKVERILRMKYVPVLLQFSLKEKHLR